MPRDDLTPKQRAFLLSYLGASNCNASAAARAAGYAHPQVQGPRLLKDPDIAAAIREHFEEAAMAAGEVLARLTAQARGPAQFLRVDGDFLSVDLAGMEAAGLMHLVKGVKTTKFGQEIEFHDAQAALVQIGRHHALFADRTEHTGPGGGPLVIREIVVEMPASEDGDAGDDSGTGDDEAGGPLAG